VCGDILRILGFPSFVAVRFLSFWYATLKLCFFIGNTFCSCFGSWFSMSISVGEIGTIRLFECFDAVIVAVRLCVSMSVHWSLNSSSVLHAVSFRVWSAVAYFA